MDDTIFLHCLNLFPKFGPKRLQILANYFPTFEEAFRAPAAELLAAGLDNTSIETFVQFRTTISPEAEFSRLEESNIQLLAWGSDQYPELLTQIPTPPILLYYRGTLPRPDAIMVAAIGTRKITTYGRSVVPQILPELINAGISIVSGLAFGVDALAHTQAVAMHRPTIAVLGSGIDDKSLYPKEHALLADQIVHAGGCLMSEYPPGTPGFKQNFIARNRIISGLSIGTLIIECNLKSGSLITAQYALDQNRRVYAIPGPIYANESRGPNNLIKMGAQLVTEAADILQDLNITPELETETHLSAENPTEAIILGILNTSPLSADGLIKQSGLDAATVTTTLTFLEMKGSIKNIGAQQYIRIR